MKTRTLVLLFALTCTPLCAAPDEDPFDDLRRAGPAAGAAMPGPLLNVVASPGPGQLPAAPVPVAAPAATAAPPAAPKPPAARLSDEQLRVLGTCDHETMRKFLAAWESTAADPARRAAMLEALRRYGERRTLGGIGLLVGAGAFAGGGLAAYASVGFASAALTAAAAVSGAALIGGVAYLAFKSSLVNNARQELVRELDRIAARR